MIEHSRSSRFRCPLLYAAFLAIALRPGRGRSDDITPTRLPDQYREAAEMLATGELDTLLWEQIAPFYREPLSVPRGELRYLRDAVAGLPRELPLSVRELAPYEPWSVEKIDTFFMDFPSLEPFRPILSFRAGGLAHIGAVSFVSSGAGEVMPRRHVARLRLRPKGWIETDGSIEIDRHHARWGRRRIALAIPRIGEFEAGTVSPVMHDGLFYGYFPADTIAGPDPGNNWRFGGSAAWNGLHSQTPLARHGALELLYHRRSTESVVAGAFTVDPPGAALIAVGASELRVSDERGDEERFVLAHAAAGVPIGSWGLRVRTGIDVTRPQAVPLLLELRRTRERVTTSLSTTILPRGLYAPRGRRVRYVCRAFELEDSLDVTAIGLRMRMRDLSNPLFGPGLELVYRGAGARGGRGEVVFTVRGTGVAGYRVRYGLTVDAEEEWRHRAYGSVAWMPVPWLELTLDSRTYYRSRGYRSVNGEFGAALSLRNGIRLAPFVAAMSSGDGYGRVAVGGDYSLLLFEKTRSEVSIEIPLIPKGSDDATLRILSSFLF